MGDDEKETHVVGLLFALLGTTAKTQDEVEGALLLDVVVRKSATVLELLAREDKALLIRRDTVVIESVGCGKREHNELRRTPPCPGSWP